MSATYAHIRAPERSRTAPLDWQARLARPRPLVSATLGTLADAFEADQERRRVPYNTLRTLRTTLRRFRVDFGTYLTTDAEPAWFVAWIEARLALRHAPKTIRRDVYFIRKVFEHGIGLGVCTVNPIVSLPRRALPPNRVLDRSRSKLEVLELEEVARLLGCQAVLWERRLLWAVLLSTGVRIGEASGLSYADWNPTMRPLGELLVRFQWSAAERALTPTKTDLVRHVPVSSFLESWLARARARFVERQGYGPTASDVLVPYRGCRGNGADRRWSPRTALRWWHRDLELAGIPHPAAGRRRLHSARHTFATRAVQAGADWRAIAEVTHNPHEQEMAGCAFGQYVHLGWPFLCSAVEKLRFST